MKQSFKFQNYIKNNPLLNEVEFESGDKVKILPGSGWMRPGANVTGTIHDNDGEDAYSVIIDAPGNPMKTIKTKFLQPASQIKEEYTETNLLNILDDIRSHIETSSALDTGFKEFALPLLDALDYNVQNEEWDDVLLDLEDLDDSIRQVNRMEWEEVYSEMFEKAIRRVETLATEMDDEDLDEAVDPMVKRAVRDLKNVIKNAKINKENLDVEAFIQLVEKYLSEIEPGLNETEQMEEGFGKTNTEELKRVEDLLAKAHDEKNHSVKSAYEFKIKMLKILVALEKKYGKALPLLSSSMVVDYINKHFPGFKAKFGPYKQNWKAVVDHIENSLKDGEVKEGDLQEANVPENVKAFAKRKGVLQLVNQVARWAEKAGKRIVGGTAIGKNYGTLILDLTYQGGEIYIDIDQETVEVNGVPVESYAEFQEALN